MRIEDRVVTIDGAITWVAAVPSGKIATAEREEDWKDTGGAFFDDPVEEDEGFEDDGG